MDERSAPRIPRRSEGGTLLIATTPCQGAVADGIGADPIVRVVFGDQWLEAIPVLRVLALYAWVYSLGFHIGGIYKAVGRPDILLKLSIFSVIILIPTLLFGSRFGVIGVAYGHLFAVLVRRIVSLAFATRFLKMTLWDILRELAPALRAALIMAPVSYAVLPR